MASHTPTRSARSARKRPTARRSGRASPTPTKRPRKLKSKTAQPRRPKTHHGGNGEISPSVRTELEKLGRRWENLLPRLTHAKRR